MRPPGGAKKGLWTRGFAHKFRLPALALFVVLAAAAVFLLARPRAIWLVDGAYREQWERILQTTNPPRRIRVMAAPEDEGRRLPRNRYGFIISSRGPLERAGSAGETETEGEGEGGSSLRSMALYQGLASSREYQGALVLALDPWMMFKDFKDPAVSRDRVDASGGGEGVLIVPGRDADSRWAWAAQLLQRRSGVFPQDQGLWQSAVETMFRNNARFQPGAETYGWIDAMPLLYRSSPAWVYAPLSRIRSQSYQDTSGLEANRYPEPEDWHEFGIQADMLWAIPFGGEKNLKKLGDLTSWLSAPATQSAIANASGWIPAHPAATPYNAISRSARLAYLSSSFIWTFYE